MLYLKKKSHLLLTYQKGFNMKQVLTVLKYTLAIIGLFYLVQACFFLMNQANSLANAAGFVAIIMVVTGIVLFTINKIKEQLNK